MESLIKALLYLGLVLLLGAGVFGRWIGPELISHHVRRRLWVGSLAGAAFVILGSALEVAGTISHALGAFDQSLVPTYLSETRHGNAVVVRTAAVFLLLLLGVAGRRRRAVDRLAHVAVSQGLLLTFSLTSHAAGLSTTLPILADVAHLTGVVAWGGALLYLAWLPIWPGPGQPGLPFSQAVQRVSSVGLIGVLVLIVTGLYVSILRIFGLTALTGTSYGRTLLYKIGLFTMILAVAAVNRWRLVPHLKNAPALTSLGRLVKIESLLVIGVLAITGVLTSLPLPEPATLTAVMSFQETAGPWVVSGTLLPREPDGLMLELDIRDAQGNPPTEPVNVQAVMTMQDHPMPPARLQLSRVSPASYRGAVSLPMSGRWQLAISLPEGVARVNLLAKGTSGASRFNWGEILPGLVLILFAAGQLVATYRLLGFSKRVGRVLAVFGATLAILGVFFIARDLGSQVHMIRTPGQPTLYFIDFPGRRSARVYLDPERAGPAQAHVTYFGADGNELPIAQDIDIRAGGDDRPLIQIPVHRFGPGHFIGDATLERGTTRLVIVAISPQGDALRATLVIQI